MKKETAVFVTPAIIRLNNVRIHRIVCDPEVFQTSTGQIVLIPQAAGLYTPRYIKDARKEIEEALSPLGLSVEEVDYFFPYIDKKYRWLIHFFEQAEIAAEKIVYGICDCIYEDEIRSLLRGCGQLSARWYHLRCMASCSSFDQKVNDFYLNGDHPIQRPMPQTLHSYK